MGEEPVRSSLAHNGWPGRHAGDFIKSLPNASNVVTIWQHLSAQLIADISGVVETVKGV